jgi:hypothetical protein
LAFKWLVCKRTGAEFKFVKYRIQPGARKKADKTIAKQNVYLQKIVAHERAPTADRGPTSASEYKGFHANVDRESVNLLNVWGGKPAKSGTREKYGVRFASTEYASLAGCAALDRDISAVVGIYGKSDAGPWAHATAFHREGREIFYFDANGGEFTLDSDDRAGDLLYLDLQRYAEPGDPDGYTIDDFNLYTVV